MSSGAFACYCPNNTLLIFGTRDIIFAMISDRDIVIAKLANPFNTGGLYKLPGKTHFKTHSKIYMYIVYLPT